MALSIDQLLFVKVFIFTIVFQQLFLFCDSQCMFNNGKCSYEINLKHIEENCNSKVVKSTSRQETFPYGQNDNEMSQMQKDFHIVTELHKKRIEELESSVQKLLRSAVPTGPIQQQVTSENAGEDHIVLGTLPHGALNTLNRSESGLIGKLYDEFTNLRARLKKRTTQQLETEAKLNETTHLFMKSQDELLDQGEKLMYAEHKVATMEQDKYIMQNQLKHKTEQFNILQTNHNITVGKVSDLEDKLYTVVRSESNLKEELGYYKWKLSQVEKSFSQLQVNYTVLETKLNKTEQTLRKTEVDLMDCITAKTQSFCSFEDDKMCGFTQEVEKDDFDWTRHKGSTPSSGTGPPTDHTCKDRLNGHYMYIEASGRSDGKTATMISPKYRGLESQCLSFYYHMYGNHIGTLNIYTTTDAESEINSVWRAYGNQGNVWIRSTLSIPKELARTGYRVKFEAVTRQGYRGDISVDDISVEDGDCPAGSTIVTYDKNNTSTINEHTLRRYKKLHKSLNRNG